MSDTSTDAVERIRRKLILHGYSESADFLRSLAAERDALRAALEAVELEYDPSEYSVNAQTMYDIAHAALNAKTPLGASPGGVTPR